MRVTNQMLNETARRAGLPVNNMSFLNFIKNGSEDTLSGALNRSSSVAGSRKGSYEKMGKEADRLMEKAAVFTDTSEGSVFAKARESGTNEGIYDKAEDFVEQYNSMTALLKSTSGVLNNYYRKMLDGAVSANSGELKNIGITQEKDGTLRIDADKLKETEIDALEKALGSSGEFSTKVAFLSAYISDIARANLESLSSQYNSAGTSYSAWTGRYSFRG